MSRYLTGGVALTETKLAKHGQVIEAIRQLLEHRAPGLVSPDDTFITGERDDVCIMVIPHHYLGGTSLVVVSAPVGIDVRWTAVTDLSDHDQLDLGHVVERWPTGQPSMDGLRARCEAELARPIEWEQVYRGPAAKPQRVRASLVINGKRISMNVLSRWSIWPFPSHALAERTSLSATQPPTFRLAVPIASLLKQA